MTTTKLYRLLLATSLTLLTACGAQTNWTKVLPGGDSLCGDGTEFAFWHRTGNADNNNLLVVMEGGGACWNNSTCTAGTGATSIAADASPDESPTGVFNLTAERNPFKDWNMVFVPYCTADLHWGNQTVEYNQNLTIHHNGFNNSMAVLSWIKDNYPSAGTMFVTGESAGGYGARLLVANAMEQYAMAGSDTQFVFLSDSSNGVITQNFLLNSFTNWGAYEIRPDWIPGIADRELAELDMQKVDIAAANHYSQHRFAEFNFRIDTVQSAFFAFMGGNPLNWSKFMLENVAEVQAAAPNYNSYLAPTGKHAIVRRSEFYTTDVAGQPFAEWIGDLANGVDVSNVVCATCQ